MNAILNDKGEHDADVSLMRWSLSRIPETSSREEDIQAGQLSATFKSALLRAWN